MSINKLPVLCYDYGWSQAGDRSHLTPGVYTHQVFHIWQPDLTVFGNAPVLAYTARFLAYNIGGLGLPAYYTAHVGGTTGLPRAASIVASSDELITATSGTQIMNRTIPWTASDVPSDHEVDGTFANPGGIAPFRFAWNSPAGQTSMMWALFFTVCVPE